MKTQSFKVRSWDGENGFWIMSDSPETLREARVEAVRLSNHFGGMEFEVVSIFTDEEIVDKVGEGDERCRECLIDVSLGSPGGIYFNRVECEDETGRKIFTCSVCDGEIRAS